MTVTRDQRETLAHFTEAPELKIGSLFSGVGGLDLAVEEFFNARTVWHCEWEVDPSKVLAARWPGVPNHGDVTKLVAPEPVDILCGGFPCQDVSLAGRRRGMKDGTRSGLWSEFARLIDQLRPSWVFIENVRGLLSADATGDVEPCPWCLADGSGEHALRALGAVLGDLADLGFDAEWTMLRASDVGAPHGRPRIFILAWPAENTGSGRNGGGPLHPDTARERGQTLRLTGQVLAMTGDLLPTPIVGDAKSVRNSTATRHKLPPTGIHTGNTLHDVLVPKGTNNATATDTEDE